MNTTTPEFDEKQDIHRLEPRSLDGEEVTGNHLVPIMREKRPPSAAVFAAFRCRWDTIALEHVADGRTSDVIAQFEQLALESTVAPGRILFGEPQEESFDFRTDWWSAEWCGSLECPFASNELLTKILQASPSTGAAERWFQGYHLARDALVAMPRALNHGEFYFQQVGWAARNGTHTLVLFDLATLARRPRFSDIGNILPLLAQESGARELDLFEAYLESLQQFTGRQSSVRQAARELRLTRVAGVCTALPWLLEAVERGEGFDLRSELLLKTRCLRDDLVALDIIDAAEGRHGGTMALNSALQATD